jgi:hypothetical protein
VPSRHRGQRPARGARSEGHPPRDQLGQGDDRKRAHGQPVGEHQTDLVVPDAEDPGHDQPDGGKAESADRRPPELAHGQAAEAALDEEEALIDDHCQSAAGQPERDIEGELRQPREMVLRNGEQRP